MTKSNFKACVTALALLLASGAVHAQQPALQKALIGTWDGDLALEGGVHHLSLIFRMSDTTLTGYVNDGGQSFGNMDELSTSADTVRFSVQGLAFTGVVKAGTMDIDLIVFNGNHRRFSAAKVQEKAKPERDDVSRE